MLAENYFIHSRTSGEEPAVVLASSMIIMSRGLFGMVANISDANARLDQCPVHVYSTLLPAWLCIIYYGNSDTEARHLDTISHAEKTPQTGAEGSPWEGNINVAAALQAAGIMP